MKNKNIIKLCLHTIQKSNVVIVKIEKERKQDYYTDRNRIER